MRIAYVCSDPGIPVFGTKGASIHVQSVVGAWSAAGHQVHLIAARLGDDRSTVPADVTVIALPGVPKTDPAGRERALVEADRAVAEVLDDVEPDLVYERYSLWGHTAMNWAADHGVPSVLEVNAPLVDEQRRHRGLHHVELAQALAVRTLSTAGAVVCVSEQVADWARTVSTAPHRVHVVPNGVDPQRITVNPHPVTPAEADVFRVGFVGTLKPWHGVEVLLDAVAALHATDPRWALTVVGDGPLAETLRDSAAARMLGPALEFTGAVTPAGIAARLHRMDIACAPYPAPAPDDAHYFSPMKIYEYLAAGLPVVASAIGQIPGLLEHGTLGVLVAPGDRVALQQALIALRADPAARAALRVAGRAAVEDRHTWSGVAARLLDLGVGSVAA